MKVGILTHYDVNNLGAQLQMYATYQWLQKHGHYPVVFTYNKNFDFEYEQKLRNQISLKSIPYITREFLLKKGIHQTWHNTQKYRKNKVFRKKNLNFEFYADSTADAVIVGADEVFSIPFGINSMMFGHGMKNGNCIAYAPSFGETNMGDLRLHHATALIKSGLETFVALSARDAHTHEMIHDLTGKNPTIVCDPVILYRFPEKLAEVKPLGKPYLAVYSYDRNMINPSEVQEIKAFAKRRGLQTVSVGNYHKWCDKNITCDCLQWLEYMRNAELVITDTFHGAVVSTILHKEAAIIQRKINRNKLKALLHDTKMGPREIPAISLSELENVFAQPTDYVTVDAALETLRSNSEQYLVRALESCSCEKSEGEKIR